MRPDAVVLRGDARRLPLPDASVDLICTSPPFWQLRSYTDNGVHYDGQIGSERTPREYVDSLLACTREWVRVLKPSGSLFVELGDKYSDRGHGPSRGNGTGRGPQGVLLQQTRGPMEKSLLDLPHRYAIRCMDELGLILRAEIIWNHVNGLPESVTDRVRRAHSVVFHFTVRPRYYAAVDEIREPHSAEHAARQAHDPRHLRAKGYAEPMSGHINSPMNPLGKLPGSVWNIPSQPLTVPAHLGVDHFAAWPMELPRRVVLGWSPPGVCCGCGEGRRPVVHRVTTGHDNHKQSLGDGARDGAQDLSPRSSKAWWAFKMAGGGDRITGYACACSTDLPVPANANTHPVGSVHGRRDRELPPTRPAVVLDPFGGTGTTALVAAAYGRTGITVDLSGDYCRLAAWRTRDPGERAKALEVPKPPPVPDGQGSLFDEAS